MTLADGPRWSGADLDRCEHGRHSIDPCFGCPSGQGEGNMFLIDPVRTEIGFTSGGRMKVSPDGTIQARIGTQVHGEPIWVTVKRSPRS